MREYIPKSVAPEHARQHSREKKRAKDQRYRLRQKVKKEVQERTDYEQGFVGWQGPIDQQLVLKSMIPDAKEKVYEFTRRTGRVINITQIHALNKRLGRRTLDYIPGKSFVTISSKERPGGRVGINRTRGYKALSALSVPYYREMTVPEVRAVLTLLVAKDGITIYGDPIDEI